MKSEWIKLRDSIEYVLQEAIKQGADSAEAGMSIESGLVSTVRLGEVETVEFTRDKGLGITVYKGKCKGSVSTSDIGIDALKASVLAACKIAEYTEADPCAGLPEPDSLAHTIPDLALYYPWDISAEQAIQLAKDCESSARSVDARITNSEGATLSSHTRYRVYGNTHGFIGSYPSTRHSLSCVVIAKSEAAMQRDYDFTVARDKRDLVSCITIGKQAAERALRRLDARKITTRSAPVIFSADIAGGIWGSFLSAISGGNLYRKSSFLLDKLGESIFPKFVHLEEAPHLLKALGSAPFDEEGVSTKQHDIVRDGILKSYVLSSYSARKLKMKTTGNCGGVHNVKIAHTGESLTELLKKMGTGLLVSELMGHGINIVTGDYSRGASGFWVENGEIQYPVEEITIAGNLADMFKNLVAIGNDTETRGNIFTGSLLLEKMMIAGN